MNQRQVPGPGRKGVVRERYGGRGIPIPESPAPIFTLMQVRGIDSKDPSKPPPRSVF